MLGRTAVGLGLLLIFSQALWVISAIYFVILPIKEMHLRNMSAVAVFARELVNADPPTESLEFLKDYSILPDTGPPPTLSRELHGFVPELQTVLKTTLGPETVVYREYAQKTLWINFTTNGRSYWVVVPKGVPPLPTYVIVTIFTLVTVSVVGAYVIIYSLTKKLRAITAAVRSIGGGDFHPILDESGPREVRDLSRGFNQMTADLRRLDDDRRLMLAGISHDLKTPLTRLRIAVDLAATRADPEIAAGIVQDVEEIDGILKQFLDYARDGTEEIPARDDLNELVASVCERQRTRGAKLVFRFGAISPFPFRRSALARAITNVVENAAKYGQVGIEVITRRDGGRVEIVVQDRGPGIRAGDPSDYIKAFARENAARTEMGAGLGLAIVARIVNTHGGELLVENRDPVGLKVTLRLPIPA
ncbi:ATP-binding protein [Congregicoccus parvus]|uniref:ATP-binding protein n=1 Tax=Congregicoccus parvus TaxID=3081749 RepID=UPI003FA58CEA